MQKNNYLLFFLYLSILFLGYLELKKLWTPPPVSKESNGELTSNRSAQKNPTLGLVIGSLANLPNSKPLPTALPVTPAAGLKVLGDESAASAFHIRARLDPRGASLRDLKLVHFQATDDYGRPEWRDQSTRQIEPLVLIPDLADRGQLSHQMFLYDPLSPSDSRPIETLGLENWESGEVETSQSKNGQKIMQVTFRKTLDHLGLEIAKTYSIQEGDYHLGLTIAIKRIKMVGEKKELPVKYQLTGAIGLPIESKWYATVFRNSLIAEEDKNGYVIRDFQDQRVITLMAGGNEVRAKPNQILRYAGTAIQYFASVLVVDHDQANQGFIERARPTLESEVTRGALKSVNEDQKSFVLVTNDNQELTFYTLDKKTIKPLGEIQEKSPGKRIAVVSSMDSRGRRVILTGPDHRDLINNEFAIQPNFEDDFTVRVMTEPTKLAVGDSLIHKYMLYNGPVKPNLLRGLDRVSDSLVDRYVDQLHLNTLTDYPSNWFFRGIGLSWLVITTTNMVHWILGHLYSVVHNYGICILLLTVFVRLIMFPLSRKQAIMGIKMQKLAPELKKLQEKYKDDKASLAQAQWDLQRRHGVNPLGTCWVLLLQMPIFMGLFFALQESINFRLAPFWPTWIINLAAPDMLADWGNRIPFISQPEWYGSFSFLGRYFNLLPVIAVVLMLIQQKMMTPPATDEQQQMNQNVMTFMMLFMGLMFFKTASGLCLYYIASSLWGFAERKMLPKNTLALAGVDTLSPDRSEDDARPSASTSSRNTTFSISPTPSSDGQGNRGRKNRRSGKKEGRRTKMDTNPPPGGSPFSGPEDSKTLGKFGEWIRKRREHFSQWWQKILDEAEKKNR